MRTWLLLLAALVPVAGCASPSRQPEESVASARPSPRHATVSGAPSSPAAPSFVAAAPSADVLRYTFDSGITGPVLDSAGRLPLRIRRAGGQLSAVPHAGGLAVRFPQPCEHYGAESCARAILQSGPAEFLNPGREEFSYGASVLLAPNETSKGANVLQKGFSVGDSQFKLQVDGAEGRPSCVIVGVGEPTIYVALASLSVADGRWHRIECARSDALLTVAVDGKTRGRSAIPPSLSIVNTDPLCIGGKGTSANNDQFAGAIDDVFITRAP
ncbi:LamG-like jellyroll fold domain-containing protein [Dactylosporangium sp. NPDC000521]|uniref:LamG-like jellyroll fold domain-containing protein n=1 Tax=Dactylosporangium sp. NPDC000521 TaxID=3363975 RepID=UPI0036A1E6B8